MKFLGLDIRRKRRGARSYAAANTGRLFADWVLSPLTANDEIKAGLRQMRDRARSLERDDAIMRRWLQQCEANIIGRGMTLRMDIRDPGGKPDAVANRTIEEAWADYWRQPTIDPAIDGNDLERLMVRCTKRDGESLWVIDRGADNRWQFALQHLEPDQLDDQRNETLSDGVRIIMGVETDRYLVPRAYHVLSEHPAETQARTNVRTVRIPRDGLIHVYRQERAGQVRGVPFAASVMADLKMLNGLHEAELVASRMAACKALFFKIPPGENYDPESYDGDKPCSDVAPGTVEKLPVGWEAQAIDWGHPNPNYAAFELAVVRRIAGGLGVSYQSLSGDLSEANYSSMRQGALDEREGWILDQEFFADRFHSRVFSEWLKMALTTGAIPLPLSKFDKFNRPTWQGRRWLWVDPSADIEAAKTAVSQGWKTNQQVASELGGDFAANVAALKDENKAKTDAGLTVGDSKDKANGQEQQQTAEKPSR